MIDRASDSTCSTAARVTSFRHSFTSCELVMSSSWHQYIGAHYHSLAR